MIENPVYDAEKYRVTAQTVYELSLSFLYEYRDRDKDYKKTFMGFLNATLQECLSIQNSILVSRGEAPYIYAPFFTDDDYTEVVPYEEALTRTAIPYAIASYYFQDENNPQMVYEYRARFVNAANEAAKAVFSDVKDVY
ncbi:MAG: hypothetical protein LBS24_07290 [Clostridiales Family XIII bacterium]|jgi:hypothetical protein|nr:hypothetical protein [Clostridiales Family XIII bacterium]